MPNHAAADVMAGITPENVINPPQCTVGEFIVNNPAAAATATINGLLQRMAEAMRCLTIWSSLTTTSRWALENVHDGVQAPMAGATRTALIRRELIQTHGGITLLGRLVVYEGRHSSQIYRRISCGDRAERPDLTALNRLEPGCGCRLHQRLNSCTCDCHEIRRVTTIAANTHGEA